MFKFLKGVFLIIVALFVIAHFFSDGKDVPSSPAAASSANIGASASGHVSVND